MLLVDAVFKGVLSGTCSFAEIDSLLVVLSGCESKTVFHNVGCALSCKVLFFLLAVYVF